MIREDRMLKKNKVILIMFALLVSVFSFCTLNANSVVSPVYADQSSDGFTLVSSLSEITDMSGKYRLQQKEGSYTYVNSIGAFSGTLDGNGCTISYEMAGEGFVETTPLFESLQMGAVVYNLRFAPTAEATSQNVNFGAKDGLSQKTSYGLLANTISNAQVYGIEFLNTNVFVYDNEALTAVPEFNAGILAGQISASRINQIKISNCSIAPYVSGAAAASSIRSNFNIGLLAGKVNNGSHLQNNLVSKSSIALSIANSQATSHNLGVLVGAFESGFITNNIIDLSGTTAYVSVVDANTEKCMNFGYIVGKTTSGLVSLYNNVVNVTVDSMLSLVGDNIFSGLILGNMVETLSAEDLLGFITCHDGKFIGNVANEVVTATYANISKIELETLFLSKINDTTLWNNIYSWNFNNVWKASSTSALPTLQYFESYSILFSSTDSVKSLSIEKLPTLSDATQSVINADFQLLDSDIALAGTTLVVPFGKAVQLTASVTELSNYSKFFKISGLLLNGVKIFDYDYETQKGVAYNGYKVSGAPNADTGEFNFVISDFTANNAGTYSVQLLRNVFKLNMYVLELEANETTIIPGKIKSNMASDGKESLTVDMIYGTKYTYETIDVNSDYAKEADWFLYNDKPNDAEFEFELDSAKTIFDQSNNLEWTFDENCVLFGSGDPEDTSDYLSLESYYYDENNLEAPETNVFTVAVLFTKDVKDIEIRFKFDDDEEIIDKIADVVIDDGAVSLTYVDGYYKAKIRYSTKTHIITLKSVSTDYQFDGWYLNSRMPQATGDTYGGTFEILNDGDTSTVVMYAVFTKEKVNDGGNMLWLWLTLAGVGVLLIAVVIIVIVKKKKSGGGSSYKKYMY